jgi:hypothetical protein
MVDTGGDEQRTPLEEFDILLDYLGRGYPFITLRMALPLSNMIYLQIDQSIVSGKQSTPTLILDKLAELGRERHAAMIESAAANLIAQGEECLALTATSQHLKIVVLLYPLSRLSITPQNSGVTLRQSMQTDANFQSCIFTRACQMAEWTLSIGFESFKRLGIDQARLKFNCAQLKLGRRDDEIFKTVREDVDKIETDVLCDLVEDDYVSTLEFLRTKLPLERAQSEKDAFDKRIARDKRRPANVIVRGKKASKGHPATPHRYLRSYLEQQFKSW